MRPRNVPAFPFAVAVASFSALGVAWASLQGCTPAFAGGSSPDQGPSAGTKGCCDFEPGAGTAAADGLAVVTLALGVEHEFELIPGSPYSEGGEWRAVAGRIDSDGTYRAPAYFPPDGIDIVQYHAPQGPVLQAVVRLEEGPGYTAEPWITVPDGFFAPADYASGNPLFSPGHKTLGSHSPVPGQALREEWIRQEWARRDWVSQHVPADGEFHMLRRSSDAPNELVQLRDGEDIESVSGLIPVPTYIGASEVEALAVRDVAGPSSRTRPRRWKAGPLYPPPDWVDEPCSNGKVRGKGGSVGVSVKWSDEIDPAGRFKVGAGMSADLYRVIGIRVDVGAEIEFSQRDGTYHAWQNFDRYRCRNGRWVYDGSVHCDRYADAVLTRPPWVARFFLAMPGDGAPGPWTPQTCYDVP